MHQQTASVNGISLLRGNVEIVNQIDNILVQRLACYASIKLRVLRIEAPLRPSSGLPWRKKLRPGTNGQEGQKAGQKICTCKELPLQ